MKDSKIVINGWWIPPILFFTSIGVIDFITVIGVGIYFIVKGNFN